MTWTLKFYDCEDVEIGFVRKPDQWTYNVSITHPDSNWDDFKDYLADYERIMFEAPSMESTEWLAHTDTFPVEEDPEPHLCRLQEIYQYPGVARSELTFERLDS